MSTPLGRSPICLPLLEPSVLHLEVVPRQRPQHLLLPLEDTLPYPLKPFLIILVGHNRLTPATISSRIRKPSLQIVDLRLVAFMNYMYWW